MSCLGAHALHTLDCMNGNVQARPYLFRTAALGFMFDLGAEVRPPPTNT